MLTHTHIFTYTHTHTHTYIHTLTSTDTPQQVRKILASGIKPDAEKDWVSVFWCKLD